MTISIGIIAEDHSDIEVLKQLIKHYKRPRQISIQPVALGGCAKVRAKCEAYSVNLFQRGCTRLIVLHDADERNPQELKDLHDQLSRAISKSKISMKVVVIPMKEVEAWLLADTKAIRKTFGIKANIKQIANPEAIRRPKEYLRDEIYKWSKKKYYNSLHNEKIASACDLTALRRCASFKPFDDFILAKC